MSQKLVSSAQVYFTQRGKESKVAKLILCLFAFFVPLREIHFKRNHRQLILILVCVFVFPQVLQAQQRWPHGDWYSINGKGLKHFSIDKQRIKYDEQSFLFDSVKEKSTSNIISIVYKNNLTCFMYIDSIDKADGDNFIQAMVVRKGRDSSYIDLILNCPENQNGDTASIRKDFYTCNSSKFMVMRYYDHKTIERFRSLKPATSMTAPELKKTNDQLLRSMKSWRKKFKEEEELAWVEWILLIDVVTDVVSGMGYNPMVTTEEYWKLFSLEVN